MPLSKHHTTSKSLFRLKRNAWLILLLLLLTVGISGCRPFIILGRIIYGDPKQPAPFKLSTKHDLEKSEQRVLVITSSRQFAHDGGSAVNIDVQEGVTRTLKRKGIKVVNPGDIASWIDDNGGVLDDPADLLDDFETDFIIHIEVDKFSLKEDKSSHLYRARFSGTVKVYQVQQAEQGDHKEIEEIWDREFASVHPRNHPVLEEHTSPELFQQNAIERLTAELARLFYAHVAAETVE